LLTENADNAHGVFAAASTTRPGSEDAVRYQIAVAAKAADRIILVDCDAPTLAPTTSAASLVPTSTPSYVPTVARRGDNRDFLR